MHGIRGMPQVDLLVSRIEDTVELTGACHSAIHRLAIFQVPAPLHLCQGCGYWRMLLLSRLVEAYTSASSWILVRGVQLIACWTCTHASGLPHRSLGSLSYTQGYHPNWIALLNSLKLPLRSISGCREPEWGNWWKKPCHLLEQQHLLLCCSF